jgi:hypothetical protein
VVFIVSTPGALLVLVSLAAASALCTLAIRFLYRKEQDLPSIFRTGDH